MSQLLSNTTSLQEVLNTLQNKAVNGEQATPEISINTLNGLITAIAGSKSSTYQLAFQAAKTITPSTASQIAVSSGYYTGGNITVAAVPTQSKTVTPSSATQDITPDSGKFLSKVTINGDSDLVASNIKSGVEIFGVTGTYEGDGSGGSGEVAEYSEAEDAMVTGTLSVYSNDRVTSIGSYAFYSCRSLTSASFPSVTSIGIYAFTNCYSLASASFPSATFIGSSAFANCSSLATASFPSVITIGNSAFANCRFTSVDFPSATFIGGDAFFNCSRLTSVNFPAAISISSGAFYYCSRLTSVNFPAATSIGGNAFYSCTALTSASFPAAAFIRSSAFGKCYKLISLYLMNSEVCTLSNSNAFSSTPIGGHSASAGRYGSIYVPMSLLASYQAATNWTYFSSRFVGVE